MASANSPGKQHHYQVCVEWTGNTGSGTSGYAQFSRDHLIKGEAKADIAGSADPAFRGDPARWNPEDLLVASLAACHKLWYLHLCAVAGVVVVDYVDEATGTMVEDIDKGGFFTEVTLHPRVTITPDSDAEMAVKLHDDAHHKCFIANSVNFPLHCQPTIVTPED